MTHPTKTAVIGHPINHSKSPLIHTHWIKQYDLNGTYEAIDIAPETLKEGIDTLITNGFSGFNVTIPHKETILPLCETIDDTARACGAVNTIVIKDGKLHGYNTDGFGFIANIKQNAPSFDFTKGPAVIIGAGGAARAIIKGLIDAGVPRIIIANRTREKADIIAAQMDATKITTIEWADRHAALENANLLVNTSSLGMTGKPPLDLGLTALPSSALVTDIVYSPLETPLLTTAKQRGNTIVTGIGMLLHQARPGFEKWHGIMPQVTKELEALVLK